VKKTFKQWVMLAGFVVVLTVPEILSLITIMHAAQGKDHVGNVYADCSAVHAMSVWAGLKIILSCFARRLTILKIPRFLFGGRVTLDEFRKLCRKEWDERKGDVMVLWLTQDSYRELQQEGVMQEQAVLHKENGAARVASREVHNSSGNAPVQVGLQLNTVMNPVTRTWVRMKLARDQDVADIYSKHDKALYSKILS
jgi:hypothetical protein